MVKKRNRLKNIRTKKPAALRTLFFMISPSLIETLNEGNDISGEPGHSTLTSGPRKKDKKGRGRYPDDPVRSAGTCSSRGDSPSFAELCKEPLPQGQPFFLPRLLALFIPRWSA